MNRTMYMINFLILMSAWCGLIFFKFNPVDNNTVYIFTLLAVLIINNGVHRKTLGMTFLPGWSDDRFGDIIKLFTR